MYPQHYIIYNTRNQNDRSTHHTPGHNLYMKKIIRRYQKNNQLNKLMKIIRKGFINCRNILILCCSHTPHNFDGTKIPGGNAYKAENRNRKIKTQFLNYSATHPDAITEYRKSGMILHIYSDASYISKPEA